MDARSAALIPGETVAHRNFQRCAKDIAPSHLLRREPRHGPEGSFRRAQVHRPVLSELGLCVGDELSVWHLDDLYDAGRHVRHHSVHLRKLPAARLVPARSPRPREKLLHNAESLEEVYAKAFHQVCRNRLPAVNVRQQVVHDYLLRLLPD